MRAADVRDLLRCEPFVPFRIRLTDGTVYEIRHPEMVWVRRSVVLVGVEARQGQAPADTDHDIVKLLHIVRVEQLDGQTSPPSQ